MGLRLFYSKYAWLENGNRLRDIALKVCRWIFEELRCNAYQCLPRRSPCLLLKSFCCQRLEQSIAAKLLLPEQIGNSKQIFYGIDHSTWMDVGVIVSSPPNHSTLSSLFIAFKNFSAPFSARSIFQNKTLCLLVTESVAYFTFFHSKGDTI